MDVELYIENLSSKMEEMRILWNNKIIRWFDNDPKHKNIHAYEFFPKNIRIIGLLIYYPDLNSI